MHTHKSRSRTCLHQLQEHKLCIVINRKHRNFLPTVARLAHMDRITHLHPVAYAIAANPVVPDAEQGTLGMDEEEPQILAA